MSKVRDIVENERPLSIYQAGSFNGKNRIINGGFNVWQRGQSFTFAAGQSGYTVDRIRTENIADGQFTVSKSNIDEKNSVKLTVDTPPTDLTLGNYWHGLSYIFEGQHLYDLAMNGENVTISFWFRSNVAGTYNVSLRNFTDTSIGVQSYVAEFNYLTAGVPQKIEVTIPLSYSWNPALQNDENIGFVLTIAFLNQGDYVTSITNQWQSGNYLTTPNCINWVSVAGNYIEIAQLQLEKGSMATEFEEVPYDVDLIRCMRYYEKYVGTIALNQYANNSIDSRDDIYHQQQFIIEKRTIPAMSFTYSYIDAPQLLGIQSTKGFTIYAVCNYASAARLNSYIADAEI